MGNKYLILLLSLIFFFFPKIVFAQDVSSQLKVTENQIAELEEKIFTLQKQAKTLADQINAMDSQIRLTTLKIQNTEEKIIDLETEIASVSAKIIRLENSLTALSEVLLKRIVETYKKGKIEPLALFFSADDFADFFRRLKYLQRMQAHDKRLMFQLQATKDDYSEQKKSLEEKKEKAEALKKQLEKYKLLLAQQKRDREVLLAVTRNDERRYQEMLAAARAEQQALLKILAGLGEVAKIGDIKAGETVGFMISGRSPCSTGTHLHFEVQLNVQPQDPARYLKNIPLNYDYDTGKIPEFVNPQGSWDWPVEEPVLIEQIYGMSYWARVFNYYGGAPHTGIDMYSQNNSRAKAVRDGTLYKGSISCGGGNLRFARVDQADGIQTYYLHIN